jgi:hypothetical protein
MERGYTRERLRREFYQDGGRGKAMGWNGTRNKVTLGIPSKRR